MIKHIVITCGVLSASLLTLPGCTSIFPDRDGVDAGGTSGGSGNTDIIYPTTTAQFGQGCLPQTALAADNCQEPDSCQVLSTSLQTTMCTHECKSNAQCPAEARCTDTPVGKVCVPRCQADYECQGRITSLRCITVAEDTGVCWTADANSGEVKSLAEPVIERIELSRCDVSGICSAGLPGPGADVQTTIYIGNRGIRDLAGLTATIIPKSGVIKNLSGSTGTVATLAGNATAVQVLAPRFTIAPEVTPGTKLDFTLRLVSPSNDVWEPTFTITAFGSPATVWITDTELSQGPTPVLEAKAGTTVSLRLLGKNIGFGDALGVQTTVTVGKGEGTITTPVSLGPDLPDYSKNPTPPDAQVIYTADLVVAPTATTSIDLDVVITDANGGQWSQTLTIPVVTP